MKNLMKKKKENEKPKEQQKYDRGQIFVKITAFALAFLLLAGAAATFIYAIWG